MKVSRIRWNRFMKIAVVDAGVGMDIVNVATNSREYDTNLGLSDKEL